MIRTAITRLKEMCLCVCEMKVVACFRICFNQIIKSKISSQWHVKLMGYFGHLTALTQSFFISID
jgi:hypothetical protein